jgi:hypothetical protein
VLGETDGCHPASEEMSDRRFKQAPTGEFEGFDSFFLVASRLEAGTRHYLKIQSR